MLEAAFSPSSFDSLLPSPDASICIPHPSPDAIEASGAGAGGVGGCSGIGSIVKLASLVKFSGSSTWVAASSP